MLVAECIKHATDSTLHQLGIIDGLVYYLSISRYLERMGDLATNIAEDVDYQVDGEIIRHGGIQTCL